VRRLAGSLGAEVLDVDLRSVSDEAWASIHGQLLEHLVLFFPGQDLDPEEHIAIGRRLGEVEIHPFIPKLSEDFPEIVVIGHDAEPAEEWHTDTTFTPRPPMASVLRMSVCPPVGGDTMWTNMYAAYESLSAPLRSLLDGLTAIHSAARFGHGDVTAEHPVVRTHPETGRKSLFVNRSFTSHIVQLGRPESDAILNFLFGWAERPRFCCRYSWTQGTIAIWDNRCTQHNPVNDYHGYRRVMHRITLSGDVPC
jgi:taurine dioxygenase